LAVLTGGAAVLKDPLQIKHIQGFVDAIVKDEDKLLEWSVFAFGLKKDQFEQVVARLETLK
jgi:hypothetical protein